MTYQDRNRAAWDRLADGGSQFARVATDEECANPLPILDGRGWLPATVDGMNVLCLASGGGWQSVLYASAGAHVTVVDISPSMLKLDRREAGRRGLQIRCVEASMDDLTTLEPEQFDIVHQPVSTCYVPDVGRVFGEVARVIRNDGIYISQHKQPVSLQVTRRTSRNHFVVGVEYYREGRLPETEDESYREPRASEYLHRLEQILGGMCHTGFVIEDVSEPRRADPNAPVNHYGYRGRFIPPYVRVKARRRTRGPQRDADSASAIWVP